MESGVCHQRSTSWRTAAGGKARRSTGPTRVTSGAAALRFSLSEATFDLHRRRVQIGLETRRTAQISPRPLSDKVHAIIRSLCSTPLLKQLTVRCPAI